jgi:hypothetical protein
MKWLLNVKLNLFLIALNYACGLMMISLWCQFGTPRFAYIGVFNMVTAVIVALGLYAREKKEV